MGSFWADLRSGLSEMHPSRFPYRRFALALALGLCGGLVFKALNLPLPFMLGAMTVCTVAAILRAPIAAPAVIRPPMSAVIGVMLGSGFAPGVLGQVVQWWPAVLGLVVFMIVAGATVFVYFRRIGGYDEPTAFFAAMPGGLIEMIAIGEERGGDARIIALVHSARILLIVLTIPFAIQWLQGVSLNRAAGSVSIFDVPMAQELWLVGCGLSGALLGHRLRLPAGTLVGPMLVSAAVHLLGFTDFKPAFEIVNAAQLVLGVVIGCRFAGMAARTVLGILALSVGSTVILIVWTVACAAAVSMVSSFKLTTLILAYCPGGLAETSLIALAIHAEVAFVASMHIVRILLVMVSAASIHGLLLRMKGRAPSQGSAAKLPAE